MIRSYSLLLLLAALASSFCADEGNAAEDEYWNQEGAATAMATATPDYDYTATFEYYYVTSGYNRTQGHQSTSAPPGDAATMAAAPPSVGLLALLLALLAWGHRLWA